ncbi:MULTISPECIES: transglycosylase domain-containing protein [unclassified Granulicatella]|uniref:transglycosylase domain-containing protein n=1 Tax=unclassified Granulicatella TaxID=2630493 RepID=UPI001073DAD7|nr:MULTISPECIES: PBP1A family penicillin-binding protein [unclassified Granulicatella]MBF0780356.1 PBP1A family penicillin-binding protein [Granulicatella sp. 19428wC4_WM01]TFU95488.1 PBP1A family penicillin-binding protein [Granulicatella sp. WM01]
MSNQKTQLSRTNKGKQNATSKKTKKNLWKRLFIYLISFFSLAVIAIVGVCAYFISNAPNVTREDLVGTLPSTIYDNKGNVITTLGGNDRILIDANSIPSLLEDALLSIEDRRFYDHKGVDLIRIAGALFANISSGKLAQGGSTITQQLIKLSVFSTTQEDQNIKRKIQEAWLSMQLEREYSKKDILALYMNKVYLANNTYGFGTAAQYYYGKQASELTLPQAALLAGLVQAPSAYDPYIYPEEARKRRDTVLEAMLSNEKITQTQYDEAIKTDIKENMVDHSNDKTANELAIDSYLQVVLSEIKEKTTLDPYTDGLEIYTNLDMDAQKHLVSVLNSADYIQWLDNNIQAAVAITNPQDGAVVALAGGRNINVQLGLNRATSATRSVGSTAKPIIDYGPAVEYLNYSSATVMSDSEIKYTSGMSLYNWDKLYQGDITMRAALQGSRNTTALRTLREVGLDNAYAFLSKLGIKVSNNGVDGLVESNSIGFVASPLQMSAAYSALANGGTYYKPYTINKIVTRSNETATYVGEGTRAMKESTAYIITDILKGIPGSSNASSSGIRGLAHAGKTGTTNYTDSELEIATGGKSVEYAAPDAWFVGYTQKYSIATWVGYDSPVSEGGYLNYAESRYPQLIYQEMMSYLSKDITTPDWKQPSSVERYASEVYVKGTYRPVITTTTTTTSTSQTSQQKPVDEESSTTSKHSTTEEKSTTYSTTTTSKR